MSSQSMIWNSKIPSIVEKYLNMAYGMLLDWLSFPVSIATSIPTIISFCESNVEKGFMLGIVHTIFDVLQFVPLSKMMRSLFEACSSNVP